ncbi:hypothetical protein BTHE68_40720 [Burkholderia sp. THE68]|nr:hypothetical protein BTHE68_40720 [Burkholderia sp. THE68]
MRHEWSRELARFEQRSKNTLSRNDIPETGSKRFRTEGASHAAFDFRTSDIKERVVTHARRASGFAVPATQAAVEMGLRLFCDFVTLKYLLDKVYAAPWSIELIPK